MASKWVASPKLHYAKHFRIPGALRRPLSVQAGPLNISEEVREAVHSNKPVVALETTIYTHGYPYPENIALSSRLESIVRQNGGIPATIGILNGVAKVGLQAEELVELLSTAGKPTTVKGSRRDLGLVCGRSINGEKLNGGTTIAGTIVLAHLAGIHVFATGGLGGVHRGGESSLDISADLTELSRTPVSLISSGCKSFLDIPRTLEYLETQGVSVSTFADGREGEVDFPAFWTRDSGVPSPATVKNEQEAAAIINAQLSFPLSSGILFANPIPAEFSLAKSEMDKITAEAIQEARSKGASGSDNTPFILKYIREATKGATVVANTALVEANVKRGTLVAAELAKLRHRRQSVLSRRLVVNHQQRAAFSTFMPQLIKNKDSSSKAGRRPVRRRVKSRSSSLRKTKQARKVKSKPDIVVAGSVAIDVSCNYNPLISLWPTVHEGELGKTGDQQVPPTGEVKLATSNPATITRSIGGVGHNVALAIRYLGVPVRLYSAVGKDREGEAVFEALKAQKMVTTAIQQDPNYPTAQYIAFNNNDKSLFTATADMTIFDGNDKKHELHYAWRARLGHQLPRWIVLDANWDAATLELWIEATRSLKHPAKVVFEPVSVEKSLRAFPLTTSKPFVQGKPPFEMTTPNEYELNAMFDHAISPAHRTAFAEATNTSLEDCPSVKALVSILDKAAAECLARDGQHSSPKSSDVRDAAAKAIYLLRYFKTILIKFGSSGVLQASLHFWGDPRLKSVGARPFLLDVEATRLSTPSHWAESASGTYLRWHPPAANVPPEEIVSVNGVGDTFLGVLIAGLTSSKRPIEDLIHVAQLGAVMTLKDTESVSRKIETLKGAFRQHNARVIERGRGSQK